VVLVERYSSLGAVYSSLGAQVDVVEMLDEMMPGADKDLIKVWTELNKDRFNRLMTKTGVVEAEALTSVVLSLWTARCEPMLARFSR